MKAEKQQLIHDLLDDESRSERTLLAGARILQRRRQWRAAQRVGIVALALLAAACWFGQKHAIRSVAKIPVTVSESSAPPQTKVEALTDEELLALFPNTPVALATLPDGRKLLIFPRPGDQQRFITRL